jgi:hypothetical protein
MAAPTSNAEVQKSLAKGAPFSNRAFLVKDFLLRPGSRFSPRSE